NATKSSRDGQRLPRRSENLAEMIPVGDSLRAPLCLRIARKLDCITMSRAGLLCEFVDVCDDRRIQIQANYLQILRLSQAEAHDCLQNRKRLDGLQGVKIVAITLVGKIESGFNDRDTMHAACGDSAFSKHGPERFFEGEVWQ